MTGPALDPYNKSDPTPILHYVARSKGWIAQRPSIESKHPKTIGENNINIMMPSDILLHCYTHRLLTTLMVIRETSSSDWLKQIQGLTAKYWAEFSEPCWREGGRIEQARGWISRTPQGNTQKQLTWAHRSSQKLDQQPGNLHGTNLNPLHMCYSF